MKLANWLQGELTTSQGAKQHRISGREAYCNFKMKFYISSPKKNTWILKPTEAIAWPNPE